MEEMYGKSDEESEWDHEVCSSVKEIRGDYVMIPEVILKDEKAYSPKLIRASDKNDTSHRGYWSSVANRSMQWFRKGGMYSIGLEIKSGVTNLQW